MDAIHEMSRTDVRHVSNQLRKESTRCTLRGASSNEYFLFCLYLSNPTDGVAADGVTDVGVTDVGTAADGVNADGVAADGPTSYLFYPVFLLVIE